MFLDALKDILARKPLPINISMVSDVMQERNSRWDVKRDTGDTFSTLCSVRLALQGSNVGGFRRAPCVTGENGL